MSSSAPDLLLDAQQLVIEQLEARAVSAQLAQATAHEKMVAAMNDHELAVATARRAVEAVQEVRHTFSRVVGSILGNQQVPQSRTLRALNADVLMEIFGAWNAMPLRLDDAPYSTGHAPAFVAASVSKQWRNVALSTPSLWTDVYLDFGYLKDVDHYLDLVMTRSRHLTLDVHMLGAPATSRNAFIADELVVRLLARCRTLDIYFVDEAVDFHESILALLQTEMLHLEKAVLHLSFENVQDLETVSSGMHIFTLCPNLRVLDVGELPLDFIDPQTLPGLQSYSTESYVILDDLMKATSVWQNLTRLELASVGMLASVLLSGARIDLPLLETLVCRNGDNPLPAMSPDRVPALKHLDVFASPSASLGFASFFSPPGLATSLTTLTLSATYDTRITESWFSTIINIPNLESLRLRTFSALGLTSLLMSWELVHWSLTKLHNLRFIRCQFTGYVIERVLDWIAKRNATSITSNIKSLSIEQDAANQPKSDLFPSWMVPRLEQLVEDVTIYGEETHAPAYVGGQDD